MVKPVNFSMVSQIVQPDEIIAMAKKVGYSLRRPEASSTLFFREGNPTHGMPAVLINVFYTTRSIMTYLNHPQGGSNELWRSNAYDDVDELQTFLENPRRHSGKGYRNKNKAARGCASCGDFKIRTDYSKNQWSKGPDENKCKACVNMNANKSGQNHEAGDNSSVISELSDALSGVDLDDATFPSLTLELLSVHNNSESGSKARDKLERRQFNCPECPKQGRGKQVFFKKVPMYKPVVKCPKCKRANRGKCLRLYPVPKSSEKGYGLFRCHECKDVWGSSRAIANIGQTCFTCLEKRNKTVSVKPFRLEVVKAKSTKKGGILGGGPKSHRSARMQRVPHEPIKEEEETNHFDYTDNDKFRNANAGGNALAGGPGGRGGFNSGEGRSYSYQARNDSSVNGSDMGFEDVRNTDTCIKVEPTLKPRIGIPKNFTHKCEGCASGICKSRYLPKSLVHDVSDGNTVSTSGSIMTNSSIDKADFIDRDQDFEGFELDEEEWITV